LTVWRPINGRQRGILGKLFKCKSFFEIQERLNAKYVKVQLKNTRSFMNFDNLINKITTKSVHIYFFALKIEFYLKLAKFVYVTLGKFNNFDLCPRGITQVLGLCPRGISQGAKRL
jgi:hypothetical protein